MKKLVKSLVIGVATFSLLAGCSKFYSGDLNKNGVKDSLKTEYDKKSQEFYIYFTEDKIDKSIFYGEGKNVSKPKVIDLDNDGLEDIAFVFQERGSEMRTLYSIINNTDTNSFEEEEFVTEEISELHYGEKNVNLRTKGLANNTPLVVVDSSIYHLEKGKWVKYDLGGKLFRSEFDINNDGVGDFVLMPYDKKLTFMVSDKDKSYYPVGLESEYKISRVVFDKEGNVVVHKVTGSHSDMEMYTYTDAKGNLQTGWRSVTVYEMLADTYEFKNNHFVLIDSREYED